MTTINSLTDRCFCAHPFSSISTTVPDSWKGFFPHPCPLTAPVGTSSYCPDVCQAASTDSLPSPAVITSLHNLAPWNTNQDTRRCLNDIAQVSRTDWPSGPENSARLLFLRKPFLPVSSAGLLRGPRPDPFSVP